MGTRDESLRALENEVGVLIRRIKRVIGERARAVHPELQGASYLMLAYIQDNGPLRASSMAESFSIDKGAVSRQVSHLLDLGLLEKSQDPDDGRAVLLQVTAEAVSRMEEIKAHRRRLIDEQLMDWSAEDLDEFVSDLARYNQALNAL